MERDRLLHESFFDNHLLAEKHLLESKEAAKKRKAQASDSEDDVDAIHRLFARKKAKQSAKVDSDSDDDSVGEDTPQVTGKTAAV